MGETIEQIEAHIENTREDLGANLRELEQRVDAATDWKHHFRARPLLMLGAAFAGGVLAAAAASGGRPRRGTTGINASSAPDALARDGGPKDRALETWDNIKGALMGVLTTRFTNYVAEFVPGFDEHYRHVARMPHPSRTDARQP